MRLRRRIILTTGIASLAQPLVSLSQPAQRLRRIGYLSGGSFASAVAQTSWSMTRDSLRKAGWAEGANLLVERRYAEGDSDRLDALAKELVGLNVELIVAAFNRSIDAAKKATSSLPIVMSASSLPVQAGYVQSLAHPGGNITGTTAQGTETTAKAFEILREVAPSLSRAAVLFDPGGPIADAFQTARIEAARSLGMTLLPLPVSSTEDIPAALERLATNKTQMLVVSASGATDSRLREIATFAVENKILCIGTSPQLPRLGGALYYGIDLQEIVDRTVSFVDRILRGAKPADLPIEQPTHFTLIVNLKTMRLLGIAVPQRVLVRATELIE